MYYYDTARLASHFVDIHERWTKFHDSTPSTKLINARKLEQTFEAFRRISKFQRIEKSNSSSRKKGFKSASRELPKDLRIFLVSRNRRTSSPRSSAWIDTRPPHPPSEMQTVVVVVVVETITVRQRRKWRESEWERGRERRWKERQIERTRDKRDEPRRRREVVLLSK